MGWSRSGPIFAGIFGLAASIALQSALISQPPAPDPEPQVDDPIPASISGPFVSDPDVLSRLDYASPDGDCRNSGPLAFACLIQARVPGDEGGSAGGAGSNPFNLPVASAILKTINDDLNSFQTSNGIDPAQQLNPGFLTHPASRIELVGIVNRIDRQFINDIVPGAEDHDRCGEISLIYRFAYSLNEGAVASRLPVTMNIVFPAIPRSRPRGAADCSGVAKRWVREMDRPPGRGVDQIVADLTNREDGIVSILDGRDIERLELNMQAYRIKAGADQTDFGSTAEYVIRVFRWDPNRDLFLPSFLTNEIDRARILGDSDGDGNSCEQGTPRPGLKQRFLAFLNDPAVLSDIDTGTLNIPQEFLACRARSVSPGGAHRSRNALLWNAAAPGEQIITNAQIERAMANARSARRQFSFMRSPDDFRLRFNEQSCSGCHQARGIAGFHFPGSDRAGTPVSNAVFLPGSPHFYGDQARRRIILRRLAQGDRLSRYDLASGYASRPLNRFRPELTNTQLLGGWGGACLLPEALASSQRQWTCQADLKCVALFASSNARGLGTCVPAQGTKIGDAMQIGTVSSSRFGVDRYERTDPRPVGNWADRANRNTLIPDDRLPPNPPADNSYYAAHQEYYQGNDSSSDLRIKRDALTGGFPSGMLRLSECRGLPSEATCGLVASSGFNACLDEVAASRKTLAQCFAQKTSYAGMRACDSSNPCRDDYICLRPMGYNRANGRREFEARQKAVSYDPSDFGQKEPDPAWLARNRGRGDQRGICIPPYFVFQFRSDGHPPPVARQMTVVAGGQSGER